MPAQVDFASSLAVLMGVPIPFGNAGRVAPELLMLAEVPDHQALYTQALTANARQVVLER